ncbi:MAG: hypothetical protein ACOCUZ_02580, partial [bacterium]
VQERVRAFQSTPAVFLSALEGEGLDDLKETLKHRIRSKLHHVTLRVPAGDGRTLASLYREGEVLARKENGVAIDVTARVPDALLGRLRKRSGIDVLEVV